MQSQLKTVVLGTGGTIAGTADAVDDNVGYAAAQLGAAQLVAAVPPLTGMPLVVEQVAQLDSKDMDYATWHRLARRVAHWLAQDDVSGVVITHGTDTLEETAYFLQRLLAPGKPVVMTAAMRPATALASDGRQNLLDAVHVARHQGARGVVAVLSGDVHSAWDVRKAHAYGVHAFSSGDAGVIAHVEEGRLRIFRDWPVGAALGLDAWPSDHWPCVHIVTSTAGADALLVEAALAHGVDGLVVAGTGNGTLHHALESALRRAHEAGVPVLRTSRCGQGALIERHPGDLPGAGALTPVQARVELLLRLAAQGQGGVRPGEGR